MCQCARTCTYSPYNPPQYKSQRYAAAHEDEAQAVNTTPCPSVLVAAPLLMVVVETTHDLHLRAARCDRVLCDKLPPHPISLTLPWVLLVECRPPVLLQEQAQLYTMPLWPP